MPESPDIMRPVSAPQRTTTLELREKPAREGLPMVVYLVYDESLKDGRIGLGVFTSLDRAKRACGANGGAPLIAIRPALVDGPVAFAKDSI